MSSEAHRFGGLDLGDLNYEKREYKKWEAYGQVNTIIFGGISICVYTCMYDVRFLRVVRVFLTEREVLGTRSGRPTARL